MEGSFGFNKGPRLASGTPSERNNPLNQNPNIEPQNNNRFTSVDGRSWNTKDESFIANKEYYRKIGRELTGKKDNPNAFNLNNFNNFNKN